jgi:hypothetical protein
MTDHDQKICLFPLATAFTAFALTTIPIVITYDLCATKSSTVLLFGLPLFPNAMRWFQACCVQQRKAQNIVVTIFLISSPITIGSSDSSDLKRTHTCRTHHLPDFYMWLSRRSASFALRPAKSHLSESLVGRSPTRPSDRNAFCLLLGFVFFLAISALLRNLERFNDFYETFFFCFSSLLCLYDVV